MYTVPSPPTSGTANALIVVMVSSVLTCAAETVEGPERDDCDVCSGPPPVIGQIGGSGPPAVGDGEADAETDAVVVSEGVSVGDAVVDGDTVSVTVPDCVGETVIV